MWISTGMEQDQQHAERRAPYHRAQLHGDGDVAGEDMPGGEHDDLLAGAVDHAVELEAGFRLALEDSNLH
jgi:hypothetical protein